MPPSTRAPTRNPAARDALSTGGAVPSKVMLDGVDLMPLLLGKASEPPHERLYWRFGPQAAMREGDYKLVRFRGQSDKLFDLRVDGSDLLDLADAFGSTQASATYRYQADMTGTTNAVDDADLTALLAKFGGQP